MKKLLCVDYQVAAIHREQRVSTNIMRFNRMGCHLIDCDYEGNTEDDYVAKMRDLFKAILRDIRALAAIYAKYYGRIENGFRVIVDRQIESNSRFVNRFIDDNNRRRNWRVIKGLKLPQRFAYCD